VKATRQRPLDFTLVKTTRTLEWSRVGDSWFADRFRIDRVSLHAWQLHWNDPADTVGVHVEEGPIAELTSLEACRHKAQSLFDETHLVKRRQRLGAIAVVGLSFAVFLSSTPLTAAIAGVIGAAALLDLFLTWGERGVVGSVSEQLQ